MVDHTHLLQPHPLLYDAQSKEQKEILKFDDVICFGVQNCAECAIITRFGAVCSSFEFSLVAVGTSA